MRRALRSALSIALLTLFSAAAFAQSPTQPATQQNQPVTTLKVTTRLVLIDAVIRDKAGNPVTDLKKEDVELLENGKPQKISVMQLEKFDAKPTAQTAAAVHKLPPNIFSNMPAVTPTDAPPTILLIDALNTTAVTQMYAREKMVQFLKTVQPGQRLAIYVLGRKLTLLQDFTSDPAILRTALDKVKPQKGPFTQPTEITAPVSDSDTLFGLQAQLGNVAATEAAINDFLNSETEVQQDTRCNITMDALESIAHHAGGFGGRKNLVWLAGGFPLTITHIDALPHELACRQRMEHTASILTDASVAIYPVDSRGLITDFDSASGIGPPGGPPNARANSTLLTDSHQAMTQIAEDTGGRAFYNGNDLDNLVKRSIADGSTYYLFGYYPQDKDWNGKFRKVTLKVNRPGLEVRSRKGYFAENPVHVIDPKDKKAQDQFGRAMQFDEAPWTQIPMDIQVVPGAQTIVRFAVDGDELSWEPLPNGGRHGSFSFVVFAYDPKGKLVGQKEENTDANLKPTDNRAHAALPFEQKLQLAPGKYLLKAAVRDNRSGLIGTVSAPVQVPGS